ncbi:hypothetical protein [Sphingobium sp. CECT 9361]|uniref:hypothetical protein n=1 Tax=Sphingobium sp. CECT 9361 TaxID=2845384 RepID=UPI001E294EF9|nr:hypothetical protein [Sphingobium sp. CECT 9361]CAH0356358.1 hypothetical protein SPH9361_04023 [Sphingobium sp. CECT 9361]
MRQSIVLEHLRAHIAQIEGVGASHGAIPFGLSELDGRLPAGGIATGALHEITGSPELGGIFVIENSRTSANVARP